MQSKVTGNEMMDKADRAESKNYYAARIDKGRCAETCNDKADALIQQGERVIARLQNGGLPSSPDLLFALEQELRNLADKLKLERESRLQMLER